MADLFNQQISATYSGLLKTTSSGVLTSSLTQITDGRGNGSPLYISTAAINFYNAYSFPITDGTADQILSTDGAGAITWVDVSGGDVLKTGTIVANQIAIWNDSVDTLRSDPSLTIDADHKITLYQPTGATDKNNYNIGGGNINTVTGTNNIGFGKNNLNSVTTGEGNVAFGYNALTSNTTGILNIAIGNSSSQNNTTGTQNVSIGANSLYHNITGSSNLAIGANSLFNNTGNSNLAIGGSALLNNTTGSSNLAIGLSALAANTVGIANVAIGINSLDNSTTAGSNVAIGYNSLTQNIIGSSNTSVGAFSGQAATGNYNVFLGYSAGSQVTTGSNNVIIGGDSGLSINGLSNRIIISDGDGTPRQTFDASGAATFNGSVYIGSASTSGIGLTLRNGGGTSKNAYLTLIGTNASSTDTTWYSGVNVFATDASFEIKNAAGNGLTLASTGAATFSGNGQFGNATTNTITINANTGNPNIEINGGIGSASVGASSYLRLRDATNSRSSFLQINANGGLDCWFQYGGVFYNRITFENTGAATFSRDVANNTDGINLYNSNNQGYGSALTFKINYAGGYDVGRIHGDWQTGDSGGLHFFTADTTQTLVERLTINGTGAATFSNNITSNYSGANFRAISAAGVSQNAYALFQGTNASSVNKQGYVGINPFGTDASLELVNSTGAGLKISQTAGAATFSGQINATASNGAIKVSGSGYTLNPTEMVIGRYTTDRGFIQVPSNGSLEVWNGGTSHIAVFNETGATSFFQGINFPYQSSGSGTSTATTLNAYEEGTWTPILQGAGTAGSYTLTNYGSTYTRVGRLVSISFTIQISAIGSVGSAYAQIAGLPYTKPANQQYNGSFRSNATMIGQYVTLIFITTSATNVLYFSASGSGGGDVQISSFSVSDFLSGTITYEI